MLLVSPDPNMLSDTPHVTVTLSHPLFSASEDFFGVSAEWETFQSHQKAKRRWKASWLLTSQDTLLEQYGLFISFNSLSHTHCKIAHFLSVTPGCQTICVGSQFWAPFKIHGVEMGHAQDTICWHFSENILTGTWHWKVSLWRNIVLCWWEDYLFYDMSDCIRGAPVFLELSSNS